MADLKNEIIDAYLFLRKHNNSISSEALDFMKGAALKVLEQQSEDNAVKGSLFIGETLQENVDKALNLCFEHYDANFPVVFISMVMNGLNIALQKSKRLNEDYKECFDDVKRLTKDIDVIMYGDDAAEQASLCDLIHPIKELAAERDALKDNEPRLKFAVESARALLEPILELDIEPEDAQDIKNWLVTMGKQSLEDHDKKNATEFFYWWYNQGGTNTQQGFDEWYKLKSDAKEGE